MKYYITLITLFFTINILHAQSPIENQVGSWLTYSGTHRVSDKVSINSCVQTWLYDVGTDFNFILMYAGVRYHISPKVTTTFAYGFTDIDSGFEKKGLHTYENRFFEQITYKHKLAKWSIDHKFRIEQRFLNKPSENVLYNRVRYRIGSKLKLNKTFFIRLNNEFIATLKNDILTENRFYSALGVNVLKSTNIQIGYLNRKINDLNLHRLQLGIFIKTDHRKKKK